MIVIEELSRAGNFDAQSVRKAVASFVPTYAEGRIRQDFLDWIRSTEPERGGKVLIAYDAERAIVGVAARPTPSVECFVVVHAGRRRQGIGAALLTRLREDWRTLQGVVARDNVPSLGLFFKCGFVATALVENHKGDRVLRFTTERKSG